MGFDLLTGRGDTMTVRQGVDLCVTPVCSRSKPMRPLVELVLDGVKATIPYRQGLAAALRCQTLLPARAEGLGRRSHPGFKIPGEASLHREAIPIKKA